MRVRMLISVAGNAAPLYDLPDFAFKPGDTPELNKDLAKAWIAAGHAEKFRKESTDAASDAHVEVETSDEAV